MRKKLPLELRFWAKVIKTENCWLWTAFRNGDGYGIIRINRERTRGTHRVSWELTNGPVPDGLLVLHKCDVPACVNPAHLFLGTNQDNTDDKMRKGRHHKIVGEQQARAKLTDASVRSIRQEKSNSTFRELAQKYGVSKSCIEFVVRGTTWSHVQ